VTFPFTRHSVVAAAASADRDTRRVAFETLTHAYWRPVYKYVRLRWHAAPEEAEDLTQGFFGRAFEKNYFEPYDPARAKFRTFLRTCLDAFVANERQASQRLKRGGAVQFVPLDVAAVEGELRAQAGNVDDYDAYFDREWVRSLFTLAVDRMRRGWADSPARIAQLRVFERYDLQAPDRDERLTYGDLAREMEMSAGDVGNLLNAARRAFRTIVVDCLRELTPTEEEFRAEARRLFGREVEE
jgi:DNA-directed RNA polymerase specialized sigma24 family protein